MDPFLTIVAAAAAFVVGECAAIVWSKHSGDASVRRMTELWSILSIVAQLAIIYFLMVFYLAYGINRVVGQSAYDMLGVIPLLAFGAIVLSAAANWWDRGLLTGRVVIRLIAVLISLLLIVGTYVMRGPHG